MFAREAARRVAPGGTVVAADLAEAALDEGRRRAVEEGVAQG
jgi:ubiquinone/menaquinone biosynthesis C-methylase UbiE